MSVFVHRRRSNIPWTDPLDEQASTAAAGHVMTPSTSGRVQFARIPALSDSISCKGPPILGDEVRHICAGAVARTMAQSIIHPFDTVKTRLQVSSKSARLTEWKSAANKVQVWLRFKGRAVLKSRNFVPQGWQDLYRGISGSVLGTIPVALIYFTAYENAKGWLERNTQAPSHLVHVSAAATGAVSSAIVRVPTDTVRHRVQAYLHSNVFTAFAEVLREKGARGLYAGFAPTIIRDVPEIAIQFAAYEALRKAVEQHQGQRLATWEHLVLGGVAGAAAATCTMPLDVLKTQLQCGAGAAGGRVGIVAACRGILEQSGPSGLFAGMGPRVVQTATMSALFFTLFEFWKAQLKPTAAREGDDKILSKKLYEKRRDHIWKRQFAFRI